MKKYVLILALIAVSGCVSLSGTGGIIMSLTAEPPTVFAKSYSKIYVDIQNIDSRPYYNVVASVFDTGSFALPSDEECSKLVNELRPNETYTFFCTLMAKDVEFSTKSDVNVKTSFDAVLSAPQKMTIMTEKWYNLQRSSERIYRRFESYSFSDKNIQMDISYNDQTPLIKNDNKKYYVYFQIKNIGGGFVKKISNVEVVSNGNYIDCSSIKNLEIIGKEIPKIACEIKQGDVDTVKDIGYIVNVHYTYEVRDKISLNIVK